MKIPTSLINPLRLCVKKCKGAKTALLLMMTILLICCKNKEQSSWTTSFENIGTYSSPRTADLNNDGVLDIVIGAGAKEDNPCDTAVLALDGRTGKTLWTLPGSNQYVGSAVFIDINNDKIPEVIIGGRWAQLIAINGANGKPIWSFYPERIKTDGSDGGWYNFTTPQFVPDQDKDGLEDIIIANGGDAKAAPYDRNRPAGEILVLSSKTGKILSEVVVPDGMETYMSVVCNRKSDTDIDVYFGTGGETLPGHLYRTTLYDIMQRNIANAKTLASSSTKGFISSPVLADINRDGIKDVIVNAVDGRMLAINGATDSLIWQVTFPGTEAYTLPAPGYFNNDSIPDFYGNFAIGTFPKLTRSIRFMVDGKTGTFIFKDTIPSFQYASAITADLDGDGLDEVIVNQSEMQRRQFHNVYYSYLFAFSPAHKRNYPLGDTVKATNLASTPWIGDLDSDGRYDVIFVSVQYQGVKFDLQQPLGLIIRRKKTDIVIKRKPKWSAFMGADYSGVF